MANYNNYPQGGYPSYPRQQPPQDNNTVKIIMIVAGAVIAIAIMVTVAIIVMNQNSGTPATEPTAAATVSPLADASQSTTAAKLKMPDLTGMSKEDAISRLSAIGVTVKEIKETETDRAKAGFVFDHVPAKDMEIKAGDEVTLYVAKQKPTTQPTTQKPTVKPTQVTYLYCIANDFVSLRTGKGTNYTELVKIPSRDAMIYIRTDGNWYYVRYGDYEGYVHGDYVSFNQNAPINSANDGTSRLSPKTYTNTLRCTADDFVSLRTGPDASYTEQEKIPRGATMTFINYSDVDSSWYYVQYGNKRGFVYSGYVEFI